MKHRVEYYVALRHENIPSLGHAIFTRHSGHAPQMLCPVSSLNAGKKKARALSAALSAWIESTRAEGIICSFVE